MFQEMPSISLVSYHKLISYEQLRNQVLHSGNFELLLDVTSRKRIILLQT